MMTWKDGQYRYTPRGTTWKPCPACGQEPQTSYKIGSICAACTNLLEWAKHERMRFGKLQGLEHRTLPTGPTRINLAHCPGSTRSPHRQEFDTACDGVERGIYALLETLSLATGGAAEIYRRSKLGPNNYTSGGIPRSTDSTYHDDEAHRRLLIRPEHAAAIDQIVPNLGIMIRCAYEAGLLDGKGLLAQLARGEITLDELAEADQSAARAIQESVTRSERMKL